MYPRAIPAEFRQKPKKQIKEFELIGRPLPFNVLALLGGMRIATRIVGNGYPTKYVNIENARKFDSGRHVGGVEEATKVLESIGAVLMERGSNPYFQFDYDPTEVLDDIVASGCIPDKQSHQYYATPEKLARIAVEWAYIGDDDQCLEPSAGQGGIAQFMPQDRTTCVEISELHCTILKAKGVNVVNADFLPWAITAGRYDRIILNPPFEGGRARLHTEYAIGLLKPGGVVVSILPASNKGKDFDGVECEWSTIYENEFAGTGVNVVILKATKCDA
jgi:predicted RNA methylase